jgi:hypothetical protein
MCKFGLVAAAVVVGVGFGWIASTKARVAPPMMMSSHTSEQSKALSRCAGVLATACAQGKRTQHGRPQGVVKG